MALSNWATFAIDQNNKMFGGDFMANGVSVEIYKNWLYIRDPAGWTDHGAFSKPVVMEVQSGDINYKGIEIYAERGPKEGVYCVISTGYVHLNSFRFIVGIGCYGYEGEDWVGVDVAEIAFLRAMLDRMDDHRFRDVDLDGGRQYNQGDLYIASKLGFAGGVPATVPGDAAPEPLLTQAIKAMEGGK